MKNQYTYIAIVCAVLLGTGVVAQAQTTTTTQQVIATSTKVTATSTITKKARLQDAVSKMERSFEVRITGLEGLAARIQTRIAKTELGGKDMTAAKTALTEAQKRIAEAKAELVSLKKADVAMVASAKPATAFVNIKNKFAKNVTTKIKAAHKALVDTITIMKGQGVTTPSTATSSTSTAQ